MEDLLDSISASINSGYVYPAFMSCLCLPDICGYLDLPDSTSKERYIDWFNKYMSKDYGNMSGEDAYSLRCVVLHHGELATTQYRTKSPRTGVILDKFLLRDGGSHLVKLTDVVVDGDNIPNIVLVNVKNFCRDMIAAAKKWQEKSGKSLGEYDEAFRIIKVSDGPVSIGGGAISIN